MGRRAALCPRRRLQDGADGSAEAFQIIRRNTRYIDAPRADDVDGVFLAQALNLLRIEAAEGKHPLLLCDKGEILRCAGSYQALGEGLPHAVDAIAHLSQFVEPGGTQIAIVENRCDQGGTVGRWIGEARPHTDLELAQYG